MFSFFSSPHHAGPDKQTAMADNKLSLFYSVKEFDKLAMRINNLVNKKDELGAECVEIENNRRVGKIPDTPLLEEKKYVLLNVLCESIERKIGDFNMNDSDHKLMLCNDMLSYALRFFDTHIQVFSTPRSNKKLYAASAFYMTSVIGMGAIATAASFSLPGILMTAWIGGNLATNLGLDLCGGETIFIPKSAQLIMDFCEELKRVTALMRTEKNFHNLYAILAISADACQAEIAKAYKQMALKYHPDRHAGKDEETIRQASEQFKIVADAYAILSDPEKKMQYDERYKDKLANYTAKCTL